MNRRVLLAVSLSVASVFATEAVYAAPSSDVPARAVATKTKMVKVNVRNDSGQPITLRTGADLLTLEAGQTRNLQLPTGTRIVMEGATPTHEAGALIAEVASGLKGATLAIR